MSSYISSKLAMIKFLEFVAEENPNIFVASMHPGTIDTATYDKSGRVPMPLDKVQLPAHFLLWLASSEAKFCRGRTVWSNWDVDELKAKAKEIESGIMLTSGVHGWPFV
ncbi:MAG: hypothetical protein M1822_008089 [Bathelium mastoideum]|nr:MAG: hypothetical protein M1822_008089 [Bathelium mastoideum]